MTVRFSPAAIAEVNRIRSKHSNPAALFRLGVQTGGCAELYYTFSLEEVVSPSDRLLDYDGIQVAIEAQSWQYLDGLTLDYTEDLMGGGFRFDNPNAISSCGCGNSFAVGDRS
ncbi:MAG: iron-sulfur cluster assembly accessory protein [Drouetiella hepatica Uher 2000/2452]|jgi:iron-sulfur cluster assembly accessory protein|uniref:Iron-sulfur cluster assembly accessory protein n=1 Tax=Drouetiella hepatica Uher 2000/2452 TaxID=904376 RepID=A0A951QB71_9CYAN|nr:iron-sulfur cluster assembly accessory protein [Drouetiella hepatica Uher 2000/2452]